MSEDLMVQDGQVVSMQYTLWVDGEVMDSSKDGDPLQFVVGLGNIIPGLEKEMIGMGMGESKDVVVAPAEGYGHYRTLLEIPVMRVSKVWMKKMLSWI